MNIIESLRDWIDHRKPDFASLVGIETLTSGEYSDMDPPLIAVYETGSGLHEVGGVILEGVSDFEINVDIVTVPADADQGGSTADEARTYARDLYEIIGDRDSIEWMDGRNGWQVFDIRLSYSTTEPRDGQRITSWSLTAVACPL